MSEGPISFFNAIKFGTLPPYVNRGRSEQWERGANQPKTTFTKCYWKKVALNNLIFYQKGAFPKIWSMKDADMKVCLLGFWGVTQIDYLVSALQRCPSHNIFTVQNLEWQDPPKLRVRHMRPCLPLWGVHPFLWSTGHSRQRLHRRAHETTTVFHRSVVRIPHWLLWEDNGEHHQMTSHKMHLPSLRSPGWRFNFNQQID